MADVRDGVVDDKAHHFVLFGGRGKRRRQQQDQGQAESVHGITPCADLDGLFGPDVPSRNAFSATNCQSL
ncbi:hypothetical protein D3C81_2142740 [compost metagenome]